jgi:acrylyl-CoA reductase (NADPH)
MGEEACYSKSLGGPLIRGNVTPASAAMEPTFRAFVAEEHDGLVRGQVRPLAADELPPGDVTIAVEFSSLNFKDALAATGQNKIAARYPHVPGIDAAGRVVESASPDWRPGDRVLVTGYELGAGRFGGYARYVRVPADWVVRMPDTLSTLQAMTIGTAGFTAALSLLAVERNGTTPAAGPVIVTGATGGVGCMAIDLFAGKGYEVVASTGKPDRHELLRTLGAASIVSREEVTLPPGTEPRHLLPSRWAAAVDTVGGATLDFLLRTTKIGGNIALSGMVGGSTFRGTVMPFILRGIGLVGIDSGHTPIGFRQAIWDRLGTDLRPRHLDLVTRRITLDDLAPHIESMLRGEEYGRIVVEV